MSDDRGLLARWRLVRQAGRDRLLSRTDVAVMMAILDRINDETGVAWPGLSRIASDANADRSSVVRSLRRLTEAGYLLRESGHRTKSNRYRMGRYERAPSCQSSPRRTVAPPGGCETASVVSVTSHLQVGASSHPELAFNNPPTEPTQANPTTDGGFAAFWIAYPKKVGKPNAQAIWNRRKLDGEAEAILADVEASSAAGGRWSCIERKYIKDPERYLKGKHWADEWQSTSRIGGALPRDIRSDDELADANEAVFLRFSAARS